MKLLNHIAVLCLAVVALVSCKSTEPATRASVSSQVFFNTALVTGISAGEAYRGFVASRAVDGGEWVSSPDDRYSTKWECSFSNGGGNIQISQNNIYYPSGRFDIYAVGYNGTDELQTRDCVLEMAGGEVGANDYIMAHTTVGLDGVGDVTQSLMFSHLFAQVRFELTLRLVGVDKDVDELLESVELVDISQLGYRLNGQIDFNQPPVGDEPWMTPSDAAMLTRGRFGVRYMVVPHSGEYAAPKNATVRVKIDGRMFEVALSGDKNMLLEQGKCRVLRMTYDGLNISAVDMPQWSVGEEIELGSSSIGNVDVPQWKQE